MCGRLVLQNPEAVSGRFWVVDVPEVRLPLPCPNGSAARPVPVVIGRRSPTRRVAEVAYRIRRTQRRG